MKLDALDHPKTLDFAARLKVARPTAIGHLELFWHFVSKHAPQGNIGKFPDGAIARASEWAGDPEEFLKSLLKSGFLDPSDEHRYLVHDWPEHCPNWVRAQLQKLKRPFFSTEERTEEGSYEPSYEGTGEPSTRARVSKPREGKGREAKREEERTHETLRNGSDHDPDGSYALTQQLKAIYPATPENSAWIIAERDISRLLEAGESAEQILANTAAYRAQQDAKGKSFSGYVYSPKNFYGRDGHWRGPFPMPQSAAPKRMRIAHEIAAQYPEDAA